MLVVERLVDPCDDDELRVVGLGLELRVEGVTICCERVGVGAVKVCERVEGCWLVAGVLVVGRDEVAGCDVRTLRVDEVIGGDSIDRVDVTRCELVAAERVAAALVRAERVVTPGCDSVVAVRAVRAVLVRPSVVTVRGRLPARTVLGRQTLS